MITRKTMIGGVAVVACAAIFTISRSSVETSAADAPPASSTQPAETVGLKAGDSVAAFHVTTIAGRLKGKSLCYV
ncbi:MAG TPA: hypothetical protein VNA16_05180 [Abditibacteriaceae bacterium]|nr:hypothetical protein [Abditibacteriaceae bacterium]